MTRSAAVALFLMLFLVVAAVPAFAQQINATLEGKVVDTSGAALPDAKVTAVGTATGLSRSVTSSGNGDYQIAGLPAGEYRVTAERSGFKPDSKRVVLTVGQTAVVAFSLAVGAVEQEVTVQAQSELVEPTRTSVSSVISEVQIQNLPVNGRQFIDFALLAPGVTVGETTSGSTDVIIEPVTKISFAGQNIHYNLVAIDGADNMSTASGVQKTTPSQEAVQEFRVINTQYSVEAGRAVGGIVNIISKSGTNNWHGGAYWFHRNDAVDAKSLLQSPNLDRLDTCNTPGVLSSGGCELLDKLIQNQYGFTLGGPVKKDKVWIFGNYEGQRRRENPFYNSVINNNITAINNIKCTLFGNLAPLPADPNSVDVCAGVAGGLPTEQLRQDRSFDYDQFLIKLDAALSDRHYLFVRYFFNDAEQINVSPLNDGFDLPSAFKNNNFRDQSLVGSLTSTLRTNLLNDLRVQYANRFFDFPTVTTQPHLEVANTFAVGVNRGNPDFYREPRFEIADAMTWTKGKHTLSFGGNFNWVSTEESFPLFYPAEATFACLYASQCGFSFENGAPFVIFFQRNDANSGPSLDPRMNTTLSGAPVGFNEPTLLPSTAVFTGGAIPTEIRNLAKGKLNHTYWGFFIQDKIRATDKLTLNLGVRYEFETWPDEALDTDADNVDPRFGFAYSVGTSKNIVFRGGIGLFHGILPSNLLHCQRPSCGGVIGQFPGRENKEDSLDAAVRLPTYAAGPLSGASALFNFLNSGTYPDAIVTANCPEGFPAGFGLLSGCGFFGDSVIVRFAQDHQAPYGIQMSFGMEMEPFKDAALNLSYLRVRGVQLSSFFNINQPSPFCQVDRHDSQGRVGSKDDYHPLLFSPVCGDPANFLPGTELPTVAVYFEADSRWSSTYDGLLVNFQKRPGKHFGFGTSYTWSKGIDNGPNPSFVLIPQDSSDTGFRRERAISSDHIAHRFVGNFTVFGPKKVNPIVNDWQLGSIISLQSARYFTKFAGFDANGDVFGVNDRVGIEPRNTFQGDGFYSIDARVSRVFNLGEKVKLEGIVEAFNLFNTLNVRFFNTTYGAADFCNISPVPAVCGAGPFFLEGSPNPTYGSPRAIFNPRQLQFALRLSF
ncbi:MAG TPA: carboxypeptidase regulatory-like domain-containing protein [Terriglobales bacterium]|nr:carboxypeptidase regulatory-like domain-containing protein [Terriglobales bacterium]